jgi:hypothetical protein
MTTIVSLTPAPTPLLPSAPPSPIDQGWRDWRPSVLRWEDDLCRHHPQALRILSLKEARAVLAEVFGACGRPVPALLLVPGFEDPQIGGWADAARHRILIEDGFLHAYLLLHEAAHLLVPEDRQHGATFIRVARTLYSAFLGIPDDDLAVLARAHGLPDEGIA